MSDKNFASYGDLETILTGYANEIKKAILNVAPKFNRTSSYTDGQYVTYNGELYKCTNNHSGAWNASHFSKTDVNTAKTSREDIAENFCNGMNAYYNKLVYKDNKLYRYVKDQTNSATWSDQDFHHVILGDLISGRALLFNGNDFWDDSDAESILSWVSMGFTGGESERCIAGLFRNVFGCGEGNYILTSNDDSLVNGIAFTTSGIYEIHFDSDACGLNAAPANPDEYLAAHCTITQLGGMTNGTINDTNANGDTIINWIKNGRTIIYNILVTNIQTGSPSSWDITLPNNIRPFYTAEGMKTGLLWGGKLAGEVYISHGGASITIGANGDSDNASGQLIAFV